MCSRVLIRHHVYLYWYALIGYKWLVLLHMSPIYEIYYTKLQKYSYKMYSHYDVRPCYHDLFMCHLFAVTCVGVRPIIASYQPVVDRRVCVVCCRQIVEERGKLKPPSLPLQVHHKENEMVCTPWAGIRTIPRADNFPPLIPSYFRPEWKPTVLLWIVLKLQAI